ncbi:DNA-processing protein DprA [Flavobacterium caeni]|uniref:DNA processing protein n=1 Tax=Flavobacterium caeni TaxID=490189 RepID=A0A1G5DTH3_9FLAO|nr:DNA-processing protein DprA [Flavobacterium caeni]SCY18036.1 DNA processing protein [Flavobacterium caeni]
MRHEDLYYVLALLKVEGVGDVLAKKLLQHCGSAREVFESKPSQLSKIDQIGSYLLRNLKDKKVFRLAETELQFIQQNRIDFLMFDQHGYPERLKHCVDGPVLLFRSGNIDFQDRKIISIVGTRQITPHGLDFCRSLVADLAPLDPIIVSGLAYGVDIAAHLAAVEHGLQTIGVVAHGLNQIYPQRHRRHRAKIEQNGGFLTEFWSDSYPAPENFVRRNRIVAGISEATIVIESAEKGGSLITANLASDYNREVFAVPGRPTDKYSQGCNQLIKSQRAHCLTSAADLVYQLNWDLQTKPRAVQKQLFVALDAAEQKIYDFLAQNGKELMDLIALRCELPIRQVSAVLLGMELKGVVRPLPGKLFEAV